MKKIRLLLSRLLSRFGYTIQVNRILYSDFKELKNVLQIWKQNNDITSYSKFLNKYTKTNFERIKFVGQGSAFNTTKTHTISKINNARVFEKIYDVNCLYYQESIKNWNPIMSILKNYGYRVPSLINKKESKIIAICHFEYIDKLPKSKADWFPELINTLKDFQKITQNELNITSRSYLEMNKIENRYYQLYVKVNEIEDVCLKFYKIKKFVERGELTFTHGDAAFTNIKNNVILDLDDAGFYPFGIDWANVIFIYLKNKYPRGTKNYEKVIDFNFIHSFIQDFNLTKKEEINILYFYLIRLQEHFNPFIINSWILDLSSKITEYENSHS